ncbi:YndM family protein [Cytobacillus oceanisediminis]|uniref:YndM family protein n=1 Tax=Cytobacillus oceanisediminis TaxID=665099 RepID=UPI00215ABB25|nr:YndM family protein [Cytobacillus oceanisediminis]
MITAFLGIVLTGFFDIGFTETLIISFVLTLAAYVLGDMMIFRMNGDETEHTKRNAIATVSDIGLSFFCYLAFRRNDRGRNRQPCIGSLCFCLVIGAGE